MSRIYLDANSIIHLVEAVSPFHAVVAARLLPYRTDPESRIVTSRLSRLECRIQPLRNADTRLQAVYDAFFSRERLIISEVTADIIKRAADLRVRYNFKTPTRFILLLLSRSRWTFSLPETSTRPVR